MLELIRGLELDMKSLSEARLEDRKYIQKLEGELQKSSEEIGALQNQLNLRNREANWLGEHVLSIELKLTDLSKLQEKVDRLREELLKSNSERLFLMRELEKKEIELQNSTFHVEKLEEALSSIALESECEIESMKLDLINLEHMSCEAKKIQEKNSLEKARMDGLIEDFTTQITNSQMAIEHLEEENRDLRNKLETSESISRTLVPRIEEYIKEWVEKKGRSQIDIRSCSKQASELHLSKETSICEEVLGPLVSKLAVVTASDEMEKMSDQVDEYKLLVEQLKDEVREEKVKAKEEAEDLTQEMAELRYQITGMLEDECKRRARIEQSSLLRISELEAQAQKEQKKSSLAAKHLKEVQKLAESRSMEIHYLKSLLKRNEVCRCGECNVVRCHYSGEEELSEAKYIVDEVMDEDTLGQPGHCMLSRRRRSK